MNSPEPHDPPDPISTEPPRSRAGLWIGSTVLLLALALRLVHWIQLVETEFFDERPFVLDARYYDKRAGEIAQGDWFGTAPGFLSPLYCQFLGAVYRLPGFGIAVSKAVQAVLGAIAAWMLYRIGRRVFGQLAGAVAGLLAATYGLFVYYTGVLLPTTLILFLHVALMWVLVGGPPSKKRLAAAGLLIGLAMGAKANALLLLPALALWLLVGFRDRPVGRRLAWTGVLVLGAAVGVAPITYGNWKTSGEFVLTTTTGGRNLLKGNGPTADGTHVIIDSRRRMSTLGTYLVDKARPLAAIKEDHRLRRDALEYMLDNPGRTAELWLRKLVLFFNHAELGIRDSYPFARTQTALLGAPLPSFGLVIPFGLAGLLLLGLRNREAGALSLVTLAQVASFVIVFVLARYRVVAVAALMVFAGGLVAYAFEGLRARRWREPAMAGLLVGLSFVLVNLDVEGIPKEPAYGEQLEYLGERASHRGEYQRAIEYFREAEKANFSVDETWGRWRVRERIGNNLALLGRTEEARGVYTRLYYEMSEEALHDASEDLLRLRMKLGELDALGQ